MDTEEKMIMMFNTIHDMHDKRRNGSCYTEIEYGEYGDPIGVHLMKDGNVCSTMSKTDILFDYVTNNLFVEKKIITNGL